MKHPMMPSISDLRQKLETFFPKSIFWEIGSVDGEDLPLPREEEDLANSFPDSRAREFRAGRIALRKAIYQSGQRVGPVLRGSHGEPIWPEGWCGSIAHTRGLVIAVAARTENHLSVGVDLETNGRIKKRLWRGFLTPDEQDWLNRNPSGADTLATAIFTIKESFYKFQYNLTDGAWLGCRGAEIAGVHNENFSSLQVVDPEHPWAKAGKMPSFEMKWINLGKWTLALSNDKH